MLGAEQVALVLASDLAGLVRLHPAHEQSELNGQPGGILRDGNGKVVLMIALEVLGGQIQTIHLLDNPDTVAPADPVAGT